MKTTHAIQSNVVVRVDIEKLLPHPANPNQMTEKSFAKLVSHIEQTGNYEPVIVRRHNKRKGCYEILNGHHRTKALAKLKSKTADCIVWEVSDERALMLLATLNNLSGRDNVRRRAELIKELSTKLSIKELVGALPESKKAIEKLKTISTLKPALVLQDYKPLVPTVFMLNTEQKAVVDKMIKEAIDPGEGANQAQRRAWALVEILRQAKNSEKKAKIS